MLQHALMHSLLAAFFIAQSASDSHWSTILDEINRKSSFSNAKRVASAQNPSRRFQSKCNNLDSDALLRKLKDEGDFNPTYMAPTLDEAAEKFEDLARKHLIRFPKRTTCDARCNETQRTFLTRLKEKNKLPPADQVDMMPDLSNMVERIPPAGLNLAAFRMNQAGNTQWFSGPAQPLPQNRPFPFTLFDNWRTKRAVDSDEDSISQAFALADERYSNEGGAWNKIGSDNLMYCWKAGKPDSQTGLHRMCSACRSIRRLPEDYFPLFVNEVLCKGSECLQNQGACVQQYIDLNVLKNIGTKECQNWNRHTIRVSVCCDCMLRPSSFLFQNYLREEN